jgi:hypothetical protein
MCSSWAASIAPRSLSIHLILVKKLTVEDDVFYLIPGTREGDDAENLNNVLCSVVGEKFLVRPVFAPVDFLTVSRLK